MSTEYHFRNDMSETTSLEKQSSFCGNSDLEIFEQTQIQFHSIKSGWNWILHRNKIEILHTTYSWNIKWQKCAGMGLNGFIFKKVNEN